MHKRNTWKVAKVSRRRLLITSTGVLTASVLMGATWLRRREETLQQQHQLVESTTTIQAATDPMNPLVEEGFSPITILWSQDGARNQVAILDEILRVEGLNYVRSARLDENVREQLTQTTVAILVEGKLDTAQVEILRDFVLQGGGLIAIRPGAELVELCGLQSQDGESANGYLTVNAQHAVCQGISTEPLQFHTPSSHYHLSGAEALAWLSDAKGAFTPNVAVSWHLVGKGALAVWSYDLGQSIVYSRQGQPERAGIEADGLDGIRASDMFAGVIDLDRIHIPQADEQQRLLLNMIYSLSATSRPLPRFWYFPDNSPSVLIATGDSHGNPVSAIDDVLKRVEQRQGTMSIYFTPQLYSNMRRILRQAKDWMRSQPLLSMLVDSSDAVTPVHAQLWRERGHEFALHPYVEEGLEIGWSRYTEEFAAMGFGPYSTTRTHRVLWHGWTETAQVQANYGIRMNLDYYHVGPALQRADGTQVVGFFNGSGLPMRFVSEDGTILDIYQQVTQLVDEQLLLMPWSTPSSNLNLADANAFAQKLIDLTIAGSYAALGAQFHFDPFAVPGEWTEDAAAWLETTLDYCVDKGLPILSAERWFHFVTMRASAEVSGFQWEPEGHMRFQCANSGQADKLTMMVPFIHNQLRLSEIFVNNAPVPFEQRTIGNQIFAVCTPSGQRWDFEAFYRA